MTRTDNRSDIERAVMRRVMLVRATRPLMSNLAGALVLLALSLYMLGREVFVAQVFRNLSGIADPVAFARFFEAAFSNTTVLVQLVLIAVLVAGFWVVWECGRQLGVVEQRYG